MKRITVFASQNREQKNTQFAIGPTASSSIQYFSFSVLSVLRFDY